MHGPSITLRISAAIALSVACSSCRPTSSPAAKGQSLTPTQLFELRSKCSDLRRKAENDYKRNKKTSGFGAGDIDSFNNRYDPEENRCYVEQFKTGYQQTKNGEVQTTQSRWVFDGQDNTALVSCNVYSYSSGTRQTACTDKDSNTIPISEAVMKMNKIMAESLVWP